MYREMDHAVLGIRKFQNAPFKLSETPAFNHRPAPLMGEHNQEVIEGLLGMSHQVLVDGYGDGTFWPTTRDRFAYMDELIAKPLSEAARSKLAGTG